MFLNQSESACVCVSHLSRLVGSGQSSSAEPWSASRTCAQERGDSARGSRHVRRRVNTSREGRDPRSVMSLSFLSGFRMQGGAWSRCGQVRSLAPPPRDHRGRTRCGQSGQAMAGPNGAIVPTSPRQEATKIAAHMERSRTPAVAPRSLDLDAAARLAAQAQPSPFVPNGVGPHPQPVGRNTAQPTAQDETEESQEPPREQDKQGATMGVDQDAEVDEAQKVYGDIRRLAMVQAERAQRFRSAPWAARPWPERQPCLGWKSQRPPRSKARGRRGGRWTPWGISANTSRS